MADEVDQFAERMLDAGAAALDLLAIAIGDRLGYYRYLAERESASPDELAAATGTSPRYAREWLEHQAVSGFLDAQEESGGRRYRMRPGVREVLADRDNLSYLAPLARQIVAASAAVPAIAEGARSGTGVPWAAFGADMRESQGDLNRPGFLQLFTSAWLGALPDVRARLAEPGARAADVGCGAGWSAIAMATEFPQLRVDAFELDPASVRMARQNVADAGLSDRVQVHERDIGAVHGSGYDLVTAFECLHDMPYPVASLQAMRELAMPNGTVLVADMKVADEFTAPGDQAERLMYGFSLSICLPDSMSSPGSAATGTVIRRSIMHGYAEAAGFANVQTLPIEHDMWRFYRMSPT